MANAKCGLVVFLLVLGPGRGVRAESPVDPGVQTVALISNVTVVEGNAGNTPFTAQVSILGTYTNLTLKIVATPGTADETDYIFAPTELTFIAGSSSTQTVSGLVIGDVDPEGNESFWLSAIATAGAPLSFMSSGGLVTITDDDRENASWLSVDNVAFPEGNEGTTTAEIPVTLRPASGYTVTVSYTTKDSTARAGEDYQAASGTLTFAPGEVRQTIPVTIIGDRFVEADEDFVIELSQAKAAIVGSERTLIVITNDDAPIHATIDDLAVDEGDTGITAIPVTAHFDHAVNGNERVQVALAGVTAVADQDFRALSTTLYPPAGATEMTFTIEVMGDTVPECDEGLLIVYSSVYMGDDTVKSAKLVLRNDDGPAPGCGADPFTPPPVDAAAQDGGSPDSPAPTTTVDTAVDVPSALALDAAGGVPSGTGDAAADEPRPALTDSGTGGVEHGDANRPARISTSGCSCSFDAARADGWLFWLAAVGTLGLLRRSRRR